MSASDARPAAHDGAAASANTADRDRVVAMLQTALATEVVCALRYRQHHYAAVGMREERLAAEFLARSEEELQHAGMIAARISELGTHPDFAPSTLDGRPLPERIESGSLRAMVVEDLAAERVAVAAYTDLIEWLGSGDPATRRLFEDILAVEEGHADYLASLLDSMPRAAAVS